MTQCLNEQHSLRWVRRTFSNMYARGQRDYLQERLIDESGKPYWQDVPTVDGTDE